jgi:rhodanese-related sulfurtransferase
MRASHRPAPRPTRRRRLYAVLSVLLLFAACAPVPKADALDPEAFAAAWDAARSEVPPPLLVDVYRPEVKERARGLEGARVLAIGTDKPRAAFADVDRDTPVYLYCGDGKGSAQIAKILDDLGFTRVHNLDGGLKAWVRAGWPTVPMETLAPFGAPSRERAVPPSAEGHSPSEQP